MYQLSERWDGGGRGPGSRVESCSLGVVKCSWARSQKPDVLLVYECGAHILSLCVWRSRVTQRVKRSEWSF